MCKRSTLDPLARTLQDNFGITLIRLPTSRIKVGSLFCRSGGRLVHLGPVFHAVTPPLEKKGLGIRHTRSPDIEGSWSSAIDVEPGIELASGFFTAIGAPGLVESLTLGLKDQNTSKVKFAFANVRASGCDPVVIGEKLARRRFDYKGNAALDPSADLFLCLATYSSNGFAIRPRDSSDREVDIDLGFLKGFISPSFKIDKTTHHHMEITFAGKANLVFGVELFKAEYDTEEHRMSIEPGSPDMDICGIHRNGGIFGDSVIHGEPSSRTVLAGQNDDLFVDWVEA